MKIGIVGFGHVGKVMKELFTEAAVYDINGIGNMDEINLSETVFVCVPTPANPDGSCNTSIVESVISEIQSNLIILRSTVPVGFTDMMMTKYRKEIVFQPEYYGETVAHPFTNLGEREWLSFGGTKRGIHLAIQTYQTVINSNVRIYQAEAREVELAKYMENAFLATKVIFCNEMYDIAKSLGLSYDIAREIWIADPRIGSSHTFCYEWNRGYGGSCLPKDISSIVSQADKAGYSADFLKAVISKNSWYKGENNG